MLAAGFTCALRVVTDDSSIGAHAFLTLPVLWAAKYRHRDGVVRVTGSALAADAVTLLSLQPVGTVPADLFLSGPVPVVVAVVLHRAATTQAQLVQAVQEQADLDALTGLVNRRAFDRALHGTAHRDGAALVLIDVDAFQDDQRCPRAPGGRRSPGPPGGGTARAGPLRRRRRLPAGRRDGARRAGGLLDAVRASPVPRPDGGRLQLSVSVGVARLPGHREDPRALYSTAGAALYDAKRSGPGRTAVAPA